MRRAEIPSTRRYVDSGTIILFSMEIIRGCRERNFRGSGVLQPREMMGATRIAWDDSFMQCVLARASESGLRFFRPLKRALPFSPSIPRKCKPNLLFEILIAANDTSDESTRPSQLRGIRVSSEEDRFFGKGPFHTPPSTSDELFEIYGRSFFKPLLQLSLSCRVLFARSAELVTSRHLLPVLAASFGRLVSPLSARRTLASSPSSFPLFLFGLSLLSPSFLRSQPAPVSFTLPCTKLLSFHSFHRWSLFLVVARERCRNRFIEERFRLARQATRMACLSRDQPRL